MAQHTPGPWRAREREAERISYVIASETKVIGSSARGPDACLIAAAPDLLKALREAADLIAWQADHSTGEHKARLRGAMERARAAIAKAEGK